MATGGFDAFDEEFFQRGERIGDGADDLSDLDPPARPRRGRGSTTVRAALVAAGLVLVVGAAARLTVGAEDVPVLSPARTAAP